MGRVLTALCPSLDSTSIFFREDQPKLLRLTDVTSTIVHDPSFPKPCRTKRSQPLEKPTFEFATTNT